MDVFGRRLKETREARGVSLEDVADATRIAPRHLAALERSDVQALPAGPFAKGYIEGYARFLGIDPEPILEAYRSEGRRRGLDAPEAQDRIIEELSRLVEQRERTAGRTGPGWKRLALVVLGATGLGIVGFGGWRVLESDTRRTAVVPSPPPRELASPIEEAYETTPPGAPAREEEGAGASDSPEESASPPDAAPAPPAASAPAAPASTDGLEVSDSGVGTGVEDLELVGRGNQFTEGTRVVFWTHVLGGGPGDVVQHLWHHEGEVVTRAELSIGSSSWRTHSRRLLDPGLTGRWVVEARGPGGAVLARHEFLCVPVERP